MLEPDLPSKLPKNARLIYALVSAQGPGEHADAQAIYVRARREQPEIGVSTVYRALERLSAEGLIHAVKVPGGTAVLYEAARTGHAHFLCTGCGRVNDIDYDVPAADVASLNAEHGLSITGTALTFSGLCADCAAKR